MRTQGKPKGYVIWLKTITAGYHANAGGGVAAGTVVRAWIGLGPCSGEDGALRGKWLGRVQNLCGSRCYPDAEGWARSAAAGCRLAWSANSVSSGGRVSNTAASAYSRLIASITPMLAVPG